MRQTPRSSKIDVYQLIASASINSLRVDVEHHVPCQNPFSCSGTKTAIDVPVAHEAFSTARLVQLTGPKRKVSTGNLLGTTPSKSFTMDTDMNLKVIKAGMLSRKGSQTQPQDLN